MIGCTVEDGFPGEETSVHYSFYHMCTYCFHGACPFEFKNWFSFDLSAIGYFDKHPLLSFTRIRYCVFAASPLYVNGEALDVGVQLVPLLTE